MSFLETTRWKVGSQVKWKAKEIYWKILNQGERHQQNRKWFLKDWHWKNCIRSSKTEEKGWAKWTGTRALLPSGKNAPPTDPRNKTPCWGENRERYQNRLKWSHLVCIEQRNCSFAEIFLRKPPPRSNIYLSMHRPWRGLLLHLCHLGDSLSS